MKTLTTNLTVKGISKKIAKNEMVFDNEIQRGTVWDNNRKSTLISTILMGYPIPPIYTRKDAFGRYDVLDGKQRCTTLNAFVTGNFALSGLNAIEIETIGADLNGLKFGELDEEKQDKILDASLLVYYVEDATQLEIEELFRRLNNGKALTTKETNWSYCGDRETAKRLGTHDLFGQMFSKKGIENKAHISVIYKLYDMVVNGYTDADYSRESMCNLMANAVITDARQVDLWELFDQLDGILCRVKNLSKDAWKKARKEINLVSFSAVVQHVAETEEIDSSTLDSLAEFYAQFIQFPSVAYINASSNATAKNSNIVDRSDLMVFAWEEYQEQKEAEKPQFDF